MKNNLKKFFFFLFILVIICLTITISVNATSYYDLHSINTTYQYLSKNNNGLDAYYGYWQYDGNSPFQIDYNMYLYYIEPSNEIGTYNLAVETEIEYTNFLGLSRTFSSSDSIGRNSCLAGEHLNGSFTGNSFSRYASSSSTTFTSKTFSSSLEDTWTVIGN